MEAYYPISLSINSLIEEYNTLVKKNEQTRQELVALQSDNPESPRIPHLDTQVKETFATMDQLTEKFAVTLHEFLEEYVYSDMTGIIEMPSNLEGKWRKIAHDEADNLKLKHESKGKKVRKLIISKSDHSTKQNDTDFQDSPDPILKVSYKAMNGSSIKVEFTKPDENGSPVQQYNLYLSTAGSFEFKKEATSKEPFFILKNLKTSTIYLMQITAQNKFGESDRDTEFKFMTPKSFGRSTYIYGQDSGETIHPSIFKYEPSEESESEVFIDNFVSLQDNIKGKIVTVDADRTVLALLNDGKVLQWGLTFQDATYQEEDRDIQETAVPIVSDPFYCFSDENNLENTIVRSVYTGSDFCVATDIEGKVYTWGLNENGQLGLSDRNPRLVPTRVPFYNERAEEANVFIINIAIGSRNVIALDDKGKIYTWGKKQAVYGKEERDRFGQVISFENPGIDQLKPRQVTEVLNYYKVKKIASGDSFNMVITEEGHLYSWGSNPSGQLGLGLFDGKHISGSTVPRRVEFFDKDYQVLDISCGRDHCLALVESKETKTRSVFSWGSSKTGQCGHGDVGARVLPSQISFFKEKKIQSIKTSWRYSVVLCEGNNQEIEAYVFGKLCENKEMKFLLPKKFDFGKVDMKRVQSMKLGKRNIFLLTEP